jgi:hypothetical protein
MAQLNMMGHQWNMPQHHQGWPVHGGNFNGSNMSLNMGPPAFMNSEQQMWNPWMQQHPQQQQFPFPMMPGGEENTKRLFPKLKAFKNRF